MDHFLMVTSRANKINYMKKFLPVLVIAAAFASCGGGSDAVVKTDSAASVIVDSAKVIVDSAAIKVDSAVNAVADSAKSAIKTVADSAKKAVK